MDDILLKKFFEADRWIKAIDKGVGKDIRKDQLLLLADKKVRINMYAAMKEGKYRISPPHTAKIPKDTPGEYRTVYVNEPIDRIVLSIANDMLFEMCGDMVHPACRSYQSGIGCGKIVKEVSRNVCASNGEVIGWKSDLSKYFDSVPYQFIESAFDKVEKRFGASALLNVIREYYSCDMYFDENGEIQHKYQSLKQGCAVAAWLADVLLHHIDEELSGLRGYYVRYSDDMLFVGPDYKQAMTILEKRLGEMSMKLNPKKVEYLDPTHWFKFLGYSIRGSQISISSTRIKTFQKEIERRTIKKRDTSFKRAVNSVNRFLYKGDGKHSWATQILPVCNSMKDINELNKFVMDCLRAVATGKKKVGGLGFVKSNEDGCVTRGKGRNVRSNRIKMENIEGYMSLGCMYKALHISPEVYQTLVLQL